MRAAQKARAILGQHHPEEGLDPKLSDEIYKIVEGEDKKVKSH
jgi:hypothetical protein